MFLAVIGITMLSFCLGCGDNKVSEKSTKEPLPSYDITETKKLSYDRLSIHVVVSDPVSTEQIKSIANEIIENEKSAQPFCAIAIFFNDYPEYIGSGASLGIITFGPDGKIGYDKNVKKGNYDKMSFTYDIKNKKWEDRLTPEEVVIWNTTHQFFLKQRANADERPEEELFKETATAQNLPVEKVTSIFIKQSSWSNQNIK